ncbi:metallophosphoesterase family protein [Roseiarcus sp.]|uniref:metallophosphoesterase family protein n=1 Tax=Roseiarcus sp. TaxID=1969460 RepID=UPI003D0B16F2
MNFRFLHAADLHLGSPFLGLALKDEDVAARFAKASRSAFEDLVTKALEEGVSFAVIAGDVFDGEWKDASIALFLNRQLARLSNRGVPTFLLRGNHDAESLFAKSLTWSDNVFEFSTRRPETHRIKDLRVALHGRGFPHREVVENYAVDYPEPVAGWFNIGVLHTACGRAGHENYAPCTVADLAARGYDYWALGHVHAFEIVSRDPWIVYPGNLQGRSIRECGERGAVLVDVADGVVDDVRRIVTDSARWAEIFVDAAPHSDETGLLRAVEAEVRVHAEAAEGRLLAVRVVLTGATPLHARFIADRDRLRDEVEAAAQRCADDVWLERLRIDTVEPQRPPRDAALAEIDLAAALEKCEADIAVRARVTELVRTVKDKLPGGMAEDANAALGLDSILAEARALALGRMGEA